MYLKVLACDLDGTLAEAGQIAPATWDSLRQARAAGLTLVLVTGRRLETFAAEGPFAELFEAIVAENGAAVYFPRRDTVILPFGQLERPLLERLVGTAELGLEPDSVSSLPLGEAYLLCRDPACGLGAERIRFRADRRVVPHMRHLHKYLRAPLPSTKRFYFRSGPPCCAASFWEFREALQTVPLEALRYHLGRGDFERWVAEVLHDQELARRIHKLANRPLEDAELREALRGAVALRYEELESLI